MNLTEPTDEILERICDAHWNYSRFGNCDGVEFLDRFQHDAINYTLSGTVDVDGVRYGFIIRDGNWNGTEVVAWGDPDDVGIYDPGPPPEPVTFIPNFLPENNPTGWRIYTEWREQSWFQEKERAYRYDRHFQPGGMVERHYREWAATKGLRPGLLSTVMPPQKERKA